jgi:hypothetical protein
MYMDDLQVLVETAADMVVAHKTVNQWCTRWDGVINETKFAALQKGMKKELSEHLKAHNKGANPKEAIVSAMKFVGFTLGTETGTPQAWEEHTTKQINKMRARFYELSRNGLEWSGKTVSAGLALKDNILEKILYFGAELWEPGSTQYKRLNRAMANVMKTLLGLPGRTPTTWVLWETGTLPAEITMDVIKLKAWRTWRRKWDTGIGV